jgi:hypothetical protein
MVNFWIFRESSFGSPFRNVNSGRNTEGDAENNRRFEAAAQNYLQQFKGKFSIFQNFLTFMLPLEYCSNPNLANNDVDEFSWTTQNSPWLYPAIFAPLAYSLLRLYTRPSSQFIRKVGVVAVTALCYQVGVRQQVKDYDLMLLNNYHAFDQEFRDALETGDSRYLTKYL